MFYYNLTCVFMRNKTVMSDNLQVIEDKLKQYDVNTISKSGKTLTAKLYAVADFLDILLDIVLDIGFRHLIGVG